MRNNVMETVIGGVVLLVAGFFLVFAYRQADLRAVKGYELSAAFVSIGGLQQGSDVRINGIKVGTVMGQSLDPQTFNAVVTLSIRPDVRLPADTQATIASEGLLGGNYLRLMPGQSTDYIPAGGAIQNTKDFKSLEEMVGEIIFLATDAGGPSPAAPGGALGGQ